MPRIVPQSSQLISGTDTLPDFSPGIIDRLGVSPTDHRGAGRNVPAREHDLVCQGGRPAQWAYFLAGSALSFSGLSFSGLSLSELSLSFERSGASGFEGFGCAFKSG